MSTEVDQRVKCDLADGVMTCAKFNISRKQYIYYSLDVHTTRITKQFGSVSKQFAKLKLHPVRL